MPVLSARRWLLLVGAVLLMTPFSACAGIDPMEALLPLLIGDTSSGFEFPEPPEDKSPQPEPQMDALFVMKARKYQEVDRSRQDIALLMGRQVHQLMEAQDIDALEKLLRGEREYLDANIWPMEGKRAAMGGRIGLYRVYESINWFLVSHGPERAESFLAAWRKAYPQSVGLYVAQAGYELEMVARQQADERTAAATASERAQRLEAAAVGAQKLLAQAEQLAHEQGIYDPQVFNAFIETNRAHFTSPEEVMEAFKKGAAPKGIALYVDYTPLYRTFMLLLLPGWHGDSDDASHYSRWASEGFPKDRNQKDRVYALMAEAALLPGGTSPDMFLSYRLDWKRLRRGFIASALLGTMDANTLEHFCYLAYLYEDKQTAKILLAQVMGANYQPSSYKWKEGYFTFEDVRKWAAS